MLLHIGKGVKSAALKAGRLCIYGTFSTAGQCIANHVNQEQAQAFLLPDTYTKALLVPQHWEEGAQSPDLRPIL